MHAPRALPVVTSALLSVALVSAAGCSSSSSTTTTTTAPRPSTTTTENPQDLPATGAVDGVTLSVLSSPLSGTVGSTTITVTAVLKGAVVPAHLDFQISDAPAADSGSPSTSQTLSVSHPGTYHLPSAFRPPRPGTGPSP